MFRRALFSLFMLVAACGDYEPTREPRLRETSSGSDGGAGNTSGDVDSGPIVGSPTDAGTIKDAGSTPQGPQESGEATYYEAEAAGALGACGTPFPSDYLVAAINDEQYSKANCGRCVSVTGPKGTVVVRILDKCPGCDSGDLDLSETAFTKIANKADGRVKITWYFVECPF
jgi:expansin (peptidoglycan-binding protein)